MDGQIEKSLMNDGFSIATVDYCLVASSTCVPSSARHRNDWWSLALLETTDRLAAGKSNSTRYVHLTHMYIYIYVCKYVYVYMCVCVGVGGGGNPCSEGLSSHVQFLVSVPNLQAGAHGILDPPCATKLRSWMGYQGWSPWRTCSWSWCSFIIQAFWWLSGYYFVICMNNSRNRSPLRIFRYLPISATFVQCGQRRPSWTMHVNSIISSGTLSGMKRLIDEIRSFKCVYACENRYHIRHTV